MANYQYSNDLLKDVLDRCGEPQDASSEFYNQALKFLNRALDAIVAGGSEIDENVHEVWWWLRKPDSPGILTLEKEITGTVAVTNNSTSATLSASVTPSLNNKIFRIDNEFDVYRVAAHTGGTTGVTLDSVFTGTTNAAVAYSASKLVYSLPTTVLSLLSPMRAYKEGEYEIEGVDESILNRNWPLATKYKGTPRQFAIVGQDATGAISVRFSHIPTELTRVEYQYLERPAVLTDSGSQEPALPLNHRKILSDYATFLLMQLKEDSRSADVALMAKAGIRAMAREQRVQQRRQSMSMGRIYPRQDKMKLNPLRTTSGIWIR